MTRLLRLRGNGLHYAAILGVEMPAIMTLGYGQGVLRGLLTLQSLENQFHEMDVTDAYPSERLHKPTIQGTL
jgi:hypothetical protein